MNHPTVSNLLVKSNLLPQDYSATFPKLSVVELKDIKRRNQYLLIDFNPSNITGLTERQQKEIHEILFWGEKWVGMDEDNRSFIWLENFVRRVLPHVMPRIDDFDEESVLELLYISVALNRIPDHQTELHDEIQSLCDLLCSPRFGYTMEQVESRLRLLFDAPNLRLELYHAD